MDDNIQAFIDRWHASGAAERANYKLFLAELFDVIGVAHPQSASENPHENAYVFEKRVPSAHGTTNFIDLSKRGCRCSLRWRCDARNSAKRERPFHPKAAG